MLETTNSGCTSYSAAQAIYSLFSSMQKNSGNHVDYFCESLIYCGCTQTVMGQLGSDREQPWMCIGDCNSLKPTDKARGNPVTWYMVKDFEECSVRLVCQFFRPWDFTTHGGMATHGASWIGCWSIRNGQALHSLARRNFYLLEHILITVFLQSQLKNLESARYVSFDTIICGRATQNSKGLSGRYGLRKHRVLISLLCVER